MKHVFSAVEVGVGRLPAITGVGPAGVEALEPIGVAVLGRCGEVEGGEAERHGRVAEAHSQVVKQLWRRCHGCRELQHVGQDDGGRLIIEKQVFRPKGVVPVRPSEVEHAVRRTIMRAEIKLVALQSVAATKAAHAAVLWSHDREAAVRAEPQPAADVGLDAVYGAVRQPFALGKVLEPHGNITEWRADRVVEAAAARANPHAALVVHVHRVDRIRAQRCRILRIVWEVRDPPGGGVQHVQPAAVRADPDQTGPVLGQSGRPVPG